MSVHRTTPYLSRESKPMHALKATTTLAALIASTTLIACQSSQSTNSNTYSNNHEFATADAQIAHGIKVYTNNCASCHGDAGQGTDKAPFLVGEGAFEDFHTALDVAVFVTKNMPPKNTKAVSTSERDFFSVRAQQPKLTDRDYWAVLAFALSANGVQLAEPVTPQNAADIILNP